MNLFKRRFVTVRPIAVEGFQVGCARWQGMRHEQQDVCGFVEKEPLLAVLADGIGGLEDGKEAGRFAVDRVLAAYGDLRPGGNLPACLEALADQIDREMAQRQKQWGCTLLLVWIEKKQLYWLGAGDSRLYLQRGGRLYQVTQDHTLRNTLTHLALKRPDTVPLMGGGEELGDLSSYIGSGKLGELDLSRKRFALEPGDKIALCSDGVWKALTTEEISACLQGCPQEAAEKVIRTVQKKELSGQDNCTILTIW